MERPRLPLTWGDWVSGDWLGTANPMGVVKPALAGSVDNLARAFGATMGALDKTAAAPPFMVQTILDTARTRLRGRDLVIRHGDGELRLHLDDLQFDLATIPLAVGQLGSIHVYASNVSWGPRGARVDGPEGASEAAASGRRRAGVEEPGGQLDTLHVEFANVHIRPGFTPVLVSAPIRLHATVGQRALDGFLESVASKVHVKLGDGTATALRPGRETWGNAAVEPRVEGGKVRLVATAISVRTRALRAPGSGVPSLLVDLPSLPGGMEVRHMTLGDHVVHVDAAIDELSEAITPQQLANVASLVRVGAPEIDLSPEAA